MKYSYFIHKTRGPAGKTVDTFLMLPASSNELAGAQSRLQKLISSHNMHTCVSIPLEGTRIKFKGSYARLDGDLHPTLVIISSRDGSFRLPFAAGEAGLEELRRTYLGIITAFNQLRNAHLAKIKQDRNQRRIAYAASSSRRQAAVASISESVTMDEQPQVQSTKANVVYLRKPAGAQPPANSSRDESNFVATKPARKKPASKASNKPAGKNRRKVTNTKSQGLTFVKWVTIGASISILTVGALIATNANAGELPSSEQTEDSQAFTEDVNGFAGFPVPIIQKSAIVVASKASACAFDGLELGSNSLLIKSPDNSVGEPKE